ncbi:hypothetical protein, partial [Nocardioides stalactiti]|uniref:hypothetical protein n=1 Tax=Nocardioides stalactiti TaxID=2755356 RepID=UPI00160330DD
FVLDPRFAHQVGGAGSVVDAVVSDVDGDRVDDVVYTTATDRGRSYDGFRVLRSTGTGMTRSGLWARTPLCAAGECSFYFQNGS